MVWPGLADWLEQLFLILPSHGEIKAAAEENERKNEERLLRAAVKKIEEEKRRVEREKEQKKEAARVEKNAAALLARRAKQERVHNVDVLISGTQKVKRGGYSRFERYEYELKNVSLFYVGETKVDIIEEDGETTRKNRDNVEILQQQQQGE